MHPLPIHPACKNTPRRSDEEVNALRDLLLNDGQVDPILTWHGQVIDGRHRQDILIAEGIAPVYEARDSLSEAEVLTLIWSRLNIRSIKPGQLAAWWELNHPKAEPGKHDHRANQYESGKFAKDKLCISLPAGITTTMIDQLSSLRRNAPELHAQVLAGETSPSKAYKAYRSGQRGSDAAKPARPSHGGYIQPAIDAGLLHPQCPGPQRQALRTTLAEMIGVQESDITHAHRNPALQTRVDAALQTLAAKKSGKTPDQQYEEHRREVATLPESAKAKFERLVATERRLLNEIFRAEVAAEALKTAPGLREEMERERDHYIRENAHLARIKSGVTPLISMADYRFLLSVLHPDHAPADRLERFARAFDIVRKLDTYIEAFKT